MRILNLLGILLMLCVVAACEPQQDASPLFGGLDNSDVKSTKASANYTIGFPKDHQTHPEFAVEWWYLTANLFDSTGNQYPLQWTLFRFLNSQSDTPWSNKNAYMAHAKIATLNNSWFEERFARGGVGNAGVSASPFTAFMDDWVWRATSSHLLPAHLEFSLDGGISAKLSLTSDKVPILHGENGYSIKLKNGTQASHYYSQPFIRVSGHILIEGREIEVKGKAWFDHEWSPQYFDKTTLGWDWFSMHLDNGSKLMLFRMRNKEVGDYWSGTFIDQQGKVASIEETDIDAIVSHYSEVKGKRLPLNWHIKIPKYALELRISPFKQDQWNEGIFSYYEGAISIDGPVKGYGFIELTGY